MIVVNLQLHHHLLHNCQKDSLIVHDVSNLAPIVARTCGMKITLICAYYQSLTFCLITLLFWCSFPSSIPSPPTPLLSPFHFPAMLHCIYHSCMSMHLHPSSPPIYPPSPKLLLLGKILQNRIWYMNHETAVTVMIPYLVSNSF